MRFTQDYPGKMEWWFYIGMLFLVYPGYKETVVSTNYNGFNCTNREKKNYYKVPKNWYSGKGGPGQVTNRVSIDHCVAVAWRI